MKKQSLSLINFHFYTQGRHNINNFKRFNLAYIVLQVPNKSILFNILVYLLNEGDGINVDRGHEYDFLAFHILEIPGALEFIYNLIHQPNLVNGLENSKI